MTAARAVIFSALLLCTISGSPIDLGEPRDASYRLPEQVIPVSYVIWLRPDLEASTFEGEVKITVQAREAAIKNITLHSTSINVTTITVTADGLNDDLYLGKIEDEVRDFLVIQLIDDLDVGTNYTIHIKYEGILHDNMYGFYKSTYVTDDGETKSIAATQFQPTHARKAFPCFDEPSFKAKFQITIDTPPGYTSLSNTAVDNSSAIGDRTDYVFKETPIVSTYLVAFVVSDFHSLNTTAEDVVYKTWARGNAIDAGAYSIQVTPAILQEMEEFTGIKYTLSGLEKVDQVALPDFSAGAMENWGLITYRETALLYDSRANTASNKQRVATVIAHELAHMWFGNLVTTDWWMYTWLNEGFATYFEYYATSKVETEMRMMDQFVVAVQQSIFGTDALNSAHPLTQDTNTPAEISAMFSGITYSKGGSILRMLSHSLTEGTFKTALEKYLTARQFATAKPEQLFAHLSEQAAADGVVPDSVNVTVALRQWTTQPGYPVITAERNYEEKSVHITQSRFLLTPSADSDSVWYVPLTWTTESRGFTNTMPQAWLTANAANISADIPEADKWVIFNVQETGYYRVNYDDRNWNLLTAALKANHEAIHVLNRAQLLDDALNLARAGVLPYATALGLAEYLGSEADYVPWSSALNAFSFLNRRLAGHAEYSAFQDYVLQLLRPVYDSLGFVDTASHIEKLHRSSVLTWACNLGHEDCNRAAAARLRALVDNGTEVEPDLKSVVYCAGLRQGDASSWDFLWSRYQNSLDASEKTLLLSSLGCTTNETLLTDYLGKSINSSSSIRMQDASSVFSAVYSNPRGVDTALSFLSDNLEAINNYYGSMGAIGNIVRGLAAQISTEAQQTKLVNFVESNKDLLATAGDTAVQTVNENLSWSTKHQEAIFNHIKGVDSTSSDPTQESTTPQSTTPETDSAPGVPSCLNTVLITLAACVVYFR